MGEGHPNILEECPLPTKCWGNVHPPPMGFIIVHLKNVSIWWVWQRRTHNSSSHLPIFASKETVEFNAQLVPHTNFMWGIWWNFVTEKYTVMITQIWHVNGGPSPNPLHARYYVTFCCLKYTWLAPFWRRLGQFVHWLSPGFQWVAIPTNGLCMRNLAIFCHWNIQWQHPFKDHQVLHTFESLWTRLIVGI